MLRMKMEREIISLTGLLLLVVQGCAFITETEASQCLQLSELIDKDPCLTDGQWSDWTTWSACSMTCGTGMTSRKRTCTNLSPSQLRQACEGDSTEYDLCFNDIPCPVNGFWSTWSPWGCTFLQEQTKVRERSCYPPLFGGQDTCLGNKTEFQHDPTCHVS